MIPLPIANGLYKDRSLPNSHQLCKNWYPSVVETQGLSQKVLYGTPGLVQRASAGGVQSTNRGAHTKEGIPYFVNGSKLYSLIKTVVSGSNVFTATEIGTIAGTERVSMADNGTQLMIVAGNNGYIYDENSTDWTIRTTPSAGGWLDITWSGSLYVAVGSTGGTDCVMTSPDGITWTQRTGSAASVWYGTAYGNSIFVAVARSGATRAMSSPDGITWTSRTIAASSWKSVAFGNGIFVAVDAATPYTSTDGITWTAQTLAMPNRLWADVIYANGQFVAVGGADTTGDLVAVSEDGINWTQGTTPGQGDLWASVAGAPAG